MIDNILSDIKYESNALEKDFNSALKKYKDDKNKLINYLLRKGYSYDEINTKLKNLVWGFLINLNFVVDFHIELLIYWILFLM